MSLNCSLVIEKSRLAIGARMCKVFAQSVFDIVWIVALKVLPGVACLAVDRVSAIAREVTNALDCVRLFLYSFPLPSIVDPTVSGGLAVLVLAGGRVGTRGRPGGDTAFLVLLASVMVVFLHVHIASSEFGLFGGGL